MTPLISIIIPVYNVDPYLDLCLQSVYNQKYQNWECILIDDGSTDDSGIICDKWSAYDSRFQVFHQKNAGVSRARNKGIRLAKGNYITFIDSDDWIDGTYISDMIIDVDSSTEDVIITGLFYDSEKTSHQLCPSTRITCSLDSEQSSLWVKYMNLFYGPVAKLYKRSIILNNSIYFPELYSLGEDMLFNLEYLRNTNKICLLPVANYHYRLTGKDTLSTIYRDDRFDIEYYLWKKRRELFNEKNCWSDELKEYMDTQLWGIVYDGIFNNKNSFIRIKQVLSIPEISQLKRDPVVFNANPMIIKAVLRRDALFFLFLRSIMK